jgi:hypothetical protein
MAGLTTVSGTVRSRSSCIPARRSVCVVSRVDPPVVLASGESNANTGEYALTFSESSEVTVIILGDGNEQPYIERVSAE